MAPSRRREEATLNRDFSSEERGPEYRLACAFRRISQGIEIESRRLGREHGITGPQLACLQAVVNYEPTTATDISAHVHLSPSTVVGILDRLEAKGLITRDRDKLDRRVVFVRPTSAGRKVVARAPDPVSRALREVLDNLTPTEQQILMSTATRLAHLVGGKSSEH